MRLTIPAKAEYITLCRLALAGIPHLRPVADETLHDLKLALTEACTNSIRHAYEANEPGDVSIVYELTEGRIAIEVTDTGPGFALGEDLEGGRITESGLGIAIIRALADELEIRHDEAEGSRLRFVKNLDTAT